MNMRVIVHPHPFLLVGADVLRGGRPQGAGWNMRGLLVNTLGAGEVTAQLEFE
jgi:hypothetical protein